MNRAKSSITQRTHHYLSRGEYHYHYCLHLLPKVLDIREQYPIIPVSRSLEIAKALKVSHPRKGNSPFEITVDFMITLDAGDGTRRYVARSFKQAKDLTDRDVLGRQAIEEALCRERNVPWKLVTDLEITDRIASRARWLFAVYAGRPHFTCTDEIAKAFLDAMREQRFEEPLKAVLNQTG